MKAFEYVGAFGGLLLGLGWILLFALSLRIHNENTSTDPNCSRKKILLKIPYSIFLSITTLGVYDLVQSLNSEKNAKKSDKHLVGLGVFLFISGIILILLELIF